MDTLPTRLVAALAHLRNAIWLHLGRDVARVPMFSRLYNRVGRIGTRFAALFARWQAGTLPLPRPPRPRRTESRRTDRPVLPYIPQGRAWLLSLPEIVRMEVAVTRGRIEALLADPAMPDFLAAAPQAGRLLRPLCHMLGITAAPGIPAALALPPTPKFRPQPPPPLPYRGIIDPPSAPFGPGTQPRTSFRRLWHV